MPAYLRQIEGRDGQSRALLASALRLKLASRITPIRHIANSLVLLGLIGTVVGFVIALSGVRPELASDTPEFPLARSLRPDPSHTRTDAPSRSLTRPPGPYAETP